MESRLAKMREGKAAGTIENLINEPEVRVVLVPLTDGEYIRALQFGDQVDAGDNPTGLSLRDTLTKEGIILFAAREIFDWTKHAFESIEEVQALGHNEINHLYDCYLEMIAAHSPSLYMLTDEEFDDLKKVWNEIPWSELSGTELYAAKRFLDSIQGRLLRASLSGSLSTEKSTRRNASETLAEHASSATPTPSPEPA